MLNLCFLGSNVESGTGTAVVVQTGSETYFGALATSITGQRQLTSFDKGIASFTWLMIGFMAVMVPLVFLFNGLSKGNWLEAFLFALAVAVGLTPEMLPMIVTVNLSKGAIAMSHKKVIVKRLNAIQNFGAMDVLCTDKTGTITEGKIVLEKHLDVRGNASARVLHYGYINSYYQTGLKNLMDVAILDHKILNDELLVDENFHKIDELPFDFQRRRMSVIVEDNKNQHYLICKGAVEEVMRLSRYVEVDGEILEVTPEHNAKREHLVRELNTDGFRVIAVAYRMFPGDNDTPHYTVADESEMTLLGYLAFLDPPKDTAAEALAKLKEHNVSVKILTGDNDAVTACICKQVGIPIDHILLGNDIEAMSDIQLGEAAETISVFAKLSPSHKERIIHALQSRGHVIGFMGDGINDAPALKAADVGVSVDTAVDIAKESSDIILLETPEFQLDASNLAVHLGGRSVFRDLSLSWAGGQVVAIVGRNGVGKTTLLRALAGLQAHAGRASGRRGTAGFRYGVPERRPAALQRDSPRRDPVQGARSGTDAVRWAACDAGLDHCESIPPLLLSEGEKKRVALATVLMRGGRHGLLLDEPSLGQDSAHKALLMRVCRALAAAGRLVVITTHDLQLAAQADRLLVLGSEGFEAEGRPADVLRDASPWGRIGLTVPGWVTARCPPATRGGRPASPPRQARRHRGWGELSGGDAGRPGPACRVVAGGRGDIREASAPTLAGSPLRRADPRVKLAMCVVRSLAVMLPLDRLLAFAGLYLVLLGWARLLPQAVCAGVAAQVGAGSAVRGGLGGVARPGLDHLAPRVVLAGVFAVLFSTTTPAEELRLAIEWARVPYRYAFSLTLAFQSVGLLDDEWRAIREAQRARGAWSPTSGWRHLREWVRTWWRSRFRRWCW